MLKTEENNKMERDIFDLEALTAELDAEFENGTLVDEEPEVEETVEGEEETPAVEPETEEVEPEVEAEPEVDGEVADDNPEEETPAVNDPDIHKRNEAFKELRLEKERLEKEAKFLKTLADSYGMSVEDLQKRFEADRDAKEAEKQGMTPEQYAKMRALEEKVSTLEASGREERFNLYADKFIADKKMTQDEFRTLAVESTKMGFDLLNNPQLIDVAWKAVNYDKALEQGRQAQLAETKRRRETSTGNTGTTGSRVDEAVNYDKEIDNFLKEQGII